MRASAAFPYGKQHLKRLSFIAAIRDKRMLRCTAASSARSTTTSVITQKQESEKDVRLRDKLILGATVGLLCTTLALTLGMALIRLFMSLPYALVFALLIVSVVCFGYGFHTMWVARDEREAKEKKERERAYQI